MTAVLKFRYLLVVATMAAVVPVLAQKKKEVEKLSIYVDSAQSTKEFTDPSKERMDSVRDLTGRLKSAKFVRPVPNEADAVLVLEVTDRIREEGISIMWGRTIQSIVRVRLTAGEFIADFEGGRSPNGPGTIFSKAAEQVADQVDKWVEMNWDRLQPLRERKRAVPATPTKIDG